MYAFESFLSLVAVLAYVNGVLRGRRGWAALLVPTLALMVYGHNWALFFCLGARDRDRPLRARAPAAVRARGGAASRCSTCRGCRRCSRRRSTPVRPGRRGRASTSCSPRPERCSAATRRSSRSSSPLPRGSRTRATGSSGCSRVLVGGTVLIAWLSSQISPAWTTRYFAVILGPAVLLAAAHRHAGRARRARSRSSRSLFLWWGFSVRNEKENAKQIAAQLAPSVRPGELVVSTHPEQVPVLRYYLGGGLRWATTLGPVSDSQVFDWRDAVSRLNAAEPRATLDPLLAVGAPGGRVRRRRARLSRLPRLAGDLDAPRLAAVGRSGRRCSSTTRGSDSSTTSSTNEIAVKRNYFKPVQAFVYRRVG